MEPVGQVIDPDGVTRRRSISNEWLIQDLLADVSPRSSTSPWGLSDEDLPPMPSRYTSSMNAHKGGEFSSAVEEYHVSLSRRETFLQDLFEDDPKFGWKEGENGQEGSGWIPERLLGEGFYGTVILWEKARRNGLVCCLFLASLNLSVNPSAAPPNCHQVYSPHRPVFPQL